MTESTDPARFEQLERAFKSIRPEHQEIIVLARVDGLTFPEMGIRLGLNVEQVEHRLALAIAALDRAVERQEKPWWRFW